MVHFKKISSIVVGFLWPIEKDELPVFIPMALMMFCLLFNFGILKSLKDSLIIPALGAEVISFLKLWLVFPAAIIFAVIYAKLANIFSIENLFYIITTFFLIFFLFFAFIIYPNYTSYHISQEALNRLCAEYLHAQWFIKIIGTWSYSLMYLFGELWSTVIINLMFWQFANHITEPAKASRFYPTFGLIGNFGLVLAGNALVSFSTLDGVPKDLICLVSRNYFYKSEVTLKLTVLAIVLFGVIAMLIFKYINVLLSSKDKSLAPTLVEPVTHLSVKDSIKIVLNSSYLWHIFMIVLCYSLVINAIEGPWKASIKKFYPTTELYMEFMGHFNMWLGFACVLFVFIGSNVLKYLGWKAAALLTPLAMLVTGILFFIFIIFDKHFEYYFMLNPLFAAIVIGAVQNIISKASKYSVFDSTKEMAYLPLTSELKIKGKAAVEIIGAKAGKSMGAFLQSFMFILAPSMTIDALTPYLLIMFLTVIFIWIANINGLYKEYIEVSSYHTTK